MDQLLENLVQKLADEGHITIEQPKPTAGQGGGKAGTGRRGLKSRTNRSIFWDSRR